MRRKDRQFGEVSEKTRKNMQKIHSKDTSIEVALRKRLWHDGYRYRKNYKKLPGSPDIAITKQKIAVFCDSEFFHGKAYYWRCAERDGCGTVGLREDVLKPFIAEALGIAEFDDAEFEKQIDHIDVISAAEMVFHFKDGGTVSRTWEQPKRVGRPWTDEQRAKFKESIKGRYTPEVRQRMSEHMKQLRKERGKAWRKEK